MPENISSQEIRRDILKLLKNNGNKVFRPKEIANRLGYKDNTRYRRFRKVLAEMDEQRLVARVKGDRYTYKARPSRMEGVLSVIPKGFGFVQVEGQKADYFIRAVNMKTALDGDRVEIAPAASKRGDRRREAEIVRIVERKRKQAVGTFRQQGKFGLVLPDDKRLTHDVYVPGEAFNGATNGAKVVVSIDVFENPHGAPEGRILEVLGDAGNPETQVLALALSMDIRSGFPEQARSEAETIAVTIAPEEIARRRDLRKQAIFTIDPVDAQDFDDAIHIEPLPNGNLEVGVHIADVSHYVKPGTALDEEAFARGTSVYLVDRVIPMLPEKLSNKVCSLRPHEDKLTYSCLMEFTPDGRRISYEICETVICSVHRFTYEQAQAILDTPDADHPLAPNLHRANNLAQALTKKRMASGAVNFDLPEVRVVLDTDGNPIDIVQKVRLQAHRLIEELMLMANRTVSEHIGKKPSPLPFVYRIHDLPNGEKIRQLAEYIRAFGYRLPLREGNVKPQQLNALLADIKGTPEEPVIEEATLRAMSKAQYSTNNIGHFGLAFPHYSHFTSPIRRYPDLMAHRLLKRYAEKASPVDAEELEHQCKHASERERAAVGAERESVKLKKVQYIRQHLGDHFHGVVSGVTKFGLFVELNDILIEGMIHVRDMEGDFYEYDERTYSLVGLSSGKSYRLGDPVEVVVAAANIESREIDFMFAE